VNNEKILDISWGTLVKIAVVGLVMYVLYLIRNILIWFVFALIISILFNPLIDLLQRKKMPRVLAAIFVYLGLFIILGLVIYLITPLFVSEIKEFSQFLGQYFEKISPPLRGLGIIAFQNLETFISTIGANLEKIASNIFSAFGALFGGILSTLFILSIAIFISLEEKLIERGLKLIFPTKYESYVFSLWERLQKKIGGWFLVKILGCIFIGILTYVALLVFSTKYPLSLAIISGILNFIPIIGPFLTGVLLFIIVALDSFARAIFVLIAFIVIQQIESNIFTPILMKKFIGLSPVLVLFALAVGGKLWGIMGAILAIPLFGILFEFIKEFFEKRKREKPIVL